MATKQARHLRRGDLVLTDSGSVQGVLETWRRLSPKGYAIGPVHIRFLDQHNKINESVFKIDEPLTLVK